MDFKRLIAEVPDYPKPGINFKDLSPLMGSPRDFKEVIRIIAEVFKDKGIESVVGAEARGFIWGGAVAVALNAGFIPVRKPGKLPRKTLSATYELEYGTDKLEIHEDAVKSGQRILIVDDLLATGGTAKAMVGLVERMKGKVAGLAFVVELEFLKGRGKLGGHDIFALLKYE